MINNDGNGETAKPINSAAENQNAHERMNEIAAVIKQQIEEFSNPASRTPGTPVKEGNFSYELPSTVRSGKDEKYIPGSKANKKWADECWKEDRYLLDEARLAERKNDKGKS